MILPKKLYDGLHFQLPYMKKNFLFKDIKIFSSHIPVPVCLWFLLACLGVLAEMSRGSSSINNYLIFKGVFTHTIDQVNLYSLYPKEYEDCNHYGPFFSLIIAPFALMPLYIGCFFWCLCNAAFLFFAVKQLPFSKKQQQIVLLIGLIEMMTSIHNVQFNPMLTAWIILSYTYVSKGKDLWATLFIVAGFLVKIYGIVGLLFFLFSRNKLKFIAYSLMWLVILVCLPMLISSPTYLIQCYKDWFQSLVEKDQSNTTLTPEGNMQDISVMGLIRRAFHLEKFKNIWVTAPAALLICFPLLRIKQYRHIGYQLTYLVVALLSTVLFSSSAESATYIIAVMGVAIWFVLQDNFSNKWIMALLVFVLVLTSLSATDLFPRFLYKDFVRPYALKALPCFLIWLLAIYQLWQKDFAKHTFNSQAKA
jgi:hypothetical protein